jgi:N-acetylmuramoyl-L-alanine amidase
MNHHRFTLLSAFAGFIALASAAFGQSRTIVVDAGHGGHDRGGVPYQRIGEKGMTLDVSQRLRRVLQAQGYRVIMTRNSDVFVPLGTRVAIANSYRGATFVSVHFNSSRRAGANGVETYYYRSDSASLAASIHRNVVAGAPTENRGIRRRGFFVLRRTRVPSVLVECGFLTNPAEGRLAQSASYRQQLAERIARGIARQPAPFQRPLTSSLSRAGVSPGSDFVRASAVAERRSRYSRSRKSRVSRKEAARKKAAQARKKKATRKKSEG